MQQFMELVQDCKAKEGATDNDIDEMMSEKMPSTQTGKCLSACVAIALGIVS